MNNNNINIMIKYKYILHKLLITIPNAESQFQKLSSYSEVKNDNNF